MQNAADFFGMVAYLTVMYPWLAEEALNSASFHDERDSTAGTSEGRQLTLVASTASVDVESTASVDNSSESAAA